MKLLICLIFGHSWKCVPAFYLSLLGMAPSASACSRCGLVRKVC